MRKYFDWGVLGKSLLLTLAITMLGASLRIWSRYGTVYLECDKVDVDSLDVRKVATSYLTADSLTFAYLEMDSVKVTEAKIDSIVNAKIKIYYAELESIYVRNAHIDTIWNGFAYSSSDTALFGKATNYGLCGEAIGNYGVFGKAENFGVRGYATGNYGVEGVSDGNYAVYGFATGDYGGYFKSLTAGKKGLGWDHGAFGDSISIDRIKNNFGDNCQVDTAILTGGQAIDTTVNTFIDAGDWILVIPQETTTGFFSVKKVVNDTLIVQSSATEASHRTFLYYVMKTK